MRLVLFMAFAVAALGCTPTTQTTSLVFDPGGEALEFPLTTMGTAVASWRVVQLRNLGTEPIDVTGLEGLTPPFSASNVAGTRLEPSGSVPVTVAFQPPVDGDAEARATLVVRSTHGTATLELHGRAVPLACELPAVIDFGELGPGETATRALDFENHAWPEQLATAGALSGSFRYAAPSPRGAFIVPPDHARTVTFEASSDNGLDEDGVVQLRRAATCPASDVSLRVHGALSPCLRVTPEEHSFGSVLRDCPARDLSVQVSNVCDHEVTFETRVTSQGWPGEFELVAPSPVSLSPLSNTAVTVRHALLDFGVETGALVLVERRAERTLEVLVRLHADDRAETSKHEDVFRLETVPGRAPQLDFHLTSRPLDPSSITVAIDGSPVAGGVAAWQYDPAINAVRFAQTNPPPDRLPIVIRWDDGC